MREGNGRGQVMVVVLMRGEIFQGMCRRLCVEDTMRKGDRVYVTSNIDAPANSGSCCGLLWVDQWWIMAVGAGCRTLAPGCPNRFPQSR